MSSKIEMLRNASKCPQAKSSICIRISEKHVLNFTTETELAKKIIEKSFWVALRRCAVHLLPLTISVVILTLNIKGYYIGADFSSLIRSETINLLLLQIAAKIQELLVVASLTTVIFHIARQELLFGEGLPLGLIGSGLLFSNFGYFFSKEFLGSLSYKTNNKWKKFGFLVILVLAGLTAALAGPSSATLLVPRSQDWQAGGTSFYLNGNSSDFWPTYLSSDDTTSQPYCVGENATKYGVCPSGGFRSLWEHYGQFNSSNFQSANVAHPYAKKLSGTSFCWSIDSPASQVPPVYSLGDARSEDDFYAYTVLVQPHAATTTKHHSDQIDDRVAQATVLSPLAQVRCSAPQNLSSGSDEVQFPTLSPDGWVWRGIANLSIATLNNTAADHLRFQWVHLPDQFGAATIGSVFESAWDRNNSSRVVVGCTVFSAYFNTVLFTDEYSFWSGWYPWNIDFAHRYPAYLPPENGQPRNASNGRIAVNDTWLNLLTPPTPPSGPGYFPWQPSSIESIMLNAELEDITSLNNGSSLTEAWRNEDLTGSGKTMLIETIICSVFVDGLSRSGSHRVYNTTGPINDWTLSAYDKKANFDTLVLKGKDAFNTPVSTSGDVTKLRIKMRITGFAYEGSLAEYLAVAVLLVHIAFALFHTIWILSTRETSDSWDSISKMIALAQNSRPSTAILMNTSAGIDNLKTFSRKARIHAFRTPGDHILDHVEIIFSGEGNEEVRDSHEAVNDQKSRISVHEDFVQAHDLEHSTEDLRFNDQRHYPSTWPRDSSTSNAFTITMQDPRLLARKDSMASLLSHTKGASLLDIGMEVKNDRKYG